MANLLDDIIDRVTKMDDKETAALMATVSQATGDMVWIPQPGPQSDAYFTEADELFYGGQAGGGKSDLIMGLALTAHTNSLILRRVNKDARGFMDRTEQVLGHTNGRNLSLWEWKYNGGKIEYGGCEHEKDKERRKGIAHDLKCFDEIGDFTESQFRFIKTWTRTSIPGQRARVVCTGNPPTNAEGLWVIRYWAPWLDPRHPNPAKSGELRWFISDDFGNDKEVPGPGEYPLMAEDGSVRLRPDGQPDKVIARSRTFIRARLEDNKFYGDDYAAVLDALPAELRAAYRDGRFDLSLKDNPRQVIPTSWIMAAIERWKKTNGKPPIGIPMCAIGVDPTGGGEDEFTLAPRYDGWYAPIVAIPGVKVPLGSDMAAELFKVRRDQALPIIDAGGGYASGIIQVLEDNNIKYAVHKGSEASTLRDKSGKLKLKNERTAVIWRFREALDPDQSGGSPIMLPDDPMLISDLTAATFEVGSQGIVVESKIDLKKRLGRSPDRGDAVVNCWKEGPKQMQAGIPYRSKSQPQVNMGHRGQRR